MFFCEYCEIFEIMFIYKTTPVATLSYVVITKKTYKALV